MSQLPFDRRRPLDGILAHLTEECGGNVVGRGFIGAVSSPKSIVRLCLCAVRNLFDLDGNNYFDEPSESVTRCEGAPSLRTSCYITSLTVNPTLPQNSQSLSHRNPTEKNLRALAFHHHANVTRYTTLYSIYHTASKLLV